MGHFFFITLLAASSVGKTSFPAVGGITNVIMAKSKQVQVGARVSPEFKEKVRGMIARGLAKNEGDLIRKAIDSYGSGGKTLSKVEEGVYTAALEESYKEKIASLEAELSRISNHSLVKEIRNGGIYLKDDEGTIGKEVYNLSDFLDVCQELFNS